MIVGIIIFISGFDSGCEIWVLIAPVAGRSILISLTGPAVVQLVIFLIFLIYDLQC